MSDEIPMLDMNDPEFAEKFRKAIGGAPGETLHITTPQFDRTDGVEPWAPIGAWDALHRFTADTLKAIGCRQWDEPDEDGKVLMLFPYQWYDYIPEGMVLECINGEEERFLRGKTDGDRRFGVLAYGVRVPATQEGEG